jgi:hypothetical protein
MIRESDQLGTRLFEAGRQWGCELAVDVHLAERLIGNVEARTGRGTFEQRLEFALDLEGVADENQRHAYKMALGHLFSDRAQHKREQLNIPFAPRY